VTVPRAPSGRRGGGRRAEAAVNDKRILAVAASVLTADPGGSMAEIAGRAEVGIGSLYRRFPSKEALIQRLCLDTMQAITSQARRARDSAVDRPWEAFTAYLQGAFDAGAGSLEVLAGSFPAGEELSAAAYEMNTAIGELVQFLQDAGVVRSDVTANDLMQLPVMVRAVRVGDDSRTAALHRRYLGLLAPAFRPPAVGPLTEPPPTFQEIHSAWSATSQPSGHPPETADPARGPLVPREDRQAVQARLPGGHGQYLPEPPLRPRRR